MKLSVIILNYKVPHYLCLCVNSVLQATQDIASEVIVVDNNSQDQSMTLLKTHFPEVKQIVNSTNLGFAKANNKAVKQAKGEYICILNPDTIVTETCFKHLLTFIERQPSAGAVGCRLIDGKGHFLPESKRRVPTPKIALQKLLGRSQYYYQNNITETETGQTDVLVGAFMLLERKRYIKIGGFDERYFMYGEDIDFSYQLQQLGLQNYYVGSEICLHFKGESTRKNKDYYQRFFGAMILFYDKYYNNRLMSFSLKLVLKLAQRFATNRKSPTPTTSIKKAYIITSSPDRFASLEPKFTTLKFIKPTAELDFKPTPKSCVIIDLNEVSPQLILRKMVSWRTLNLSYRFLVSATNHLVGSDSSETQGEAINLFYDNI